MRAIRRAYCSVCGGVLVVNSACHDTGGVMFTRDMAGAVAGTVPVWCLRHGRRGPLHFPGGHHMGGVVPTTIAMWLALLLLPCNFCYCCYGLTIGVGNQTRDGLVCCHEFIPVRHAYLGRIQLLSFRKRTTLHEGCGEKTKLRKEIPTKLGKIRGGVECVGAKWRIIVDILAAFYLPFKSWY